MDHSGGTIDNIRASLAGRYASALFDLAVEGGALDAVAASLTALRGALAESHDFAALVASPLVGRADAGRAAAAVAGSLGLDALTTKFLGLLAANRRLDRLADIIAAFDRILAAHRGEMTATVTSAHPLTSAQMDALAAQLNKRLGRAVSIDARVDPALLGGLVVQLGSQLIDNSIRTRLTAFAQAMKV